MTEHCAHCGKIMRVCDDKPAEAPEYTTADQVRLEDHSGTLTWFVRAASYIALERRYKEAIRELDKCNQRLAEYDRTEPLKRGELVELRRDLAGARETIGVLHGLVDGNAHRQGPVDGDAHLQGSLLQCEIDRNNYKEQRDKAREALRDILEGFVPCCCAADLWECGRITGDELKNFRQIAEDAEG